MSANNETGSIQPVSVLGEICRARGVLFHTDAAQSFGKEPFETFISSTLTWYPFVPTSCTGQRAPELFFIKSPLLPDPHFSAAGHENERRAGTENVPAIIGLARRWNGFVKTPFFNRINFFPLTNHLINSVQSLEGVAFRVHCAIAFPTRWLITVAGCDSITLLAGLDMEGICASSGSTCSAGSLRNRRTS